MTTATLRVVVDASIAMSAGSKPGSPSPAPEAVGALEAIRASALRIAMSANLKDEWQRHRGEFARKWLLIMISTKRLDPIPKAWSGEIALIDAAADMPGWGAREVAKDAHLVGLAMLTDRRVVSLDARQRTLLRRIREAVPEIRAVHWAVPVETGVIAWLKSGAPERESLTLGSSAA